MYNYRKIKHKQHHIFYDYYTRLKMIALSVFEWENLPETCNQRFLERCLFEYGHAIFVKDANMSYLNLKVTPATYLNVYEEPTAYEAFSTGYTKTYKADECVYIRNNYLAKSTDTTIMIYAKKLTKIDNAMQVNINAQKTPVLIRCEEKTKTSLKNMYAQYEGDMPVIFGVKSLQDRPIEAITTGAPYIVDKLREEKIAVWNEALEFLGINTNPNEKKKERLIVDEVNSNNEEINIQFESMLLCRQKACEDINKLYGLNVSVKKRELESEGLNYGEIYDRT